MVENEDELVYPTKYTITLHDAVAQNPNLLTDVFTFTKPDGSVNTARQAMMVKIFTGMWGYHELGSETIPLFKQWLMDMYNQKVDYYSELIDAYQVKIDMLDGAVSDTETTFIELPNKVTGKEYATNKTRVKVTGGIDVITLKREYLDLIRNLYEDFSRDFKDCFCMIY